jgi:hypothetical protein
MRKTMNNTKRYIAFLIALALMFLLVLTGCGGGEETPAVQQSGNVDYQVSLTDALGNTYHEGIIVKFLQDGQEIAMQVVGDNGTATKSLPAGTYTVELVYTSNEAAYSYDADNVTLTAENPSLTIMMTATTSLETATLFVDGEEFAAYHVGVGCSNVPLNVGKRSYFLFTPDQAGNYEFGVEGNVATIGYYGAPHFVQSVSAVDVVDNKVQVSVSAGNLGGTLVIGLDSESADGCTLTVERIGEPIKTLADEPWHTYMKTVELSPYTLPAGAALKEFDLTASGDTYKLVLNEAEGFYHLDSADGPLVLVRLTGELEYMATYQTMLDRTGVVKYFFDDKGEFLRKESYSECLLEYIPNADEKAGVYPLTEDLKYIIQQSGDHSGWWDFDGHGYIFLDEGGNKVANINPEIAWLFMCCYIG